MIINICKKKTCTLTIYKKLLNTLLTCNNFISLFNSYTRSMCVHVLLLHIYIYYAVYYINTYGYTYFSLSYIHACTHDYKVKLRVLFFGYTPFLYLV